MSSSKLDKTLARVKQRIADHQFYEAHQALKTVAARYIKAQQYDQAIELLYHGAQELLTAGEGGSGGDLSCYLIDTYKVAKIPVDGASKARVVQLFKLFREDEPRRKEFVQDAIQWSASFGEVSYGDPELFHIFGSTFASEDLPYDAEKFLLLGTKDSPVVLAQLLYEWFSEDPEVVTVTFYIARAVLGYLTVGNIRGARQALDHYLSKFIASGRTTQPKVSSVAADEITVFSQFPLLNFYQLLIRTCQRKNTDLFKRLRFRYKNDIKEAFEGEIEESLDKIGERYFGIQVRNQANLLQDLMGSLFSGPSGGGQNRPQIQGNDLD
ncbi:hypothetical protein POJ06DRAFT_243376 [Lipomyces tetrasporus]|uniref:DUF410-domain-containing protein n=1 Tax=Lipomyces tetrasporus TaxID=54092 RepID=A0AAD7QZ16_9ASCO|nr:uncharacterized protein POJ06DRAFT_243376 [Lipomyces tetrasporus]KAJ8104023.1 hypothetical protein POJ06DRAFT_243376 [Lipomyces tetrasporus]